MESDSDDNCIIVTNKSQQKKKVRALNMKSQAAMVLQAKSISLKKDAAQMFRDRKELENKEKLLNERIIDLNREINSVQCMSCLKTMYQLKADEITMKITKCGHLFCSNCLINWRDRKGKYSCPSECGFYFRHQGARSDEAIIVFDTDLI